MVLTTILEALIYAIVVCWLAGLTLKVIQLDERTQRAEEACDTADRALAAVQDIVNHLAETEPTTGRHALAAAQALTKELPQG